LGQWQVEEQLWVSVRVGETGEEWRKIDKLGRQKGWGDLRARSTEGVGRSWASELGLW